MAAEPPAPRLAREAAAYRVLERVRWGGRPGPCPYCAAPGRCTLIRPTDGVARATRTGRPTARRLWRCTACRRQFSVLTGTVLAGTRLPISTWVEIAADHAAGRLPDVAAVRERHGVSAEAARRVVRLLAGVDAGVGGREVGGRDGVLTALLTSGAAAAVQVRSRARRPRPRPQCGPSAEYGD